MQYIVIEDFGHGTRYSGPFETREEAEEHSKGEDTVWDVAIAPLREPC